MLSFLWWSLPAAHMVWGRPHGWNWVPRQRDILTPPASLNMPHQDPCKDEIILEWQAIVHAKDSLRMKSDRHLSLLERIIKSETEGDWWWGHHNLELIQDIFDIVPSTRSSECLHFVAKYVSWKQGLSLSILLSPDFPRLQFSRARVRINHLGELVGDVDAWAVPQPADSEKPW